MQEEGVELKDQDKLVDEKSSPQLLGHEPHAHLVGGMKVRVH